MMIFTSGATGEPKAVVHTHGNFLRHGANMAAFEGQTAATRTFCAMPFFWIGGVGLVLNMALAVGSTVLCVERFDADAVLIARAARDLLASRRIDPLPWVSHRLGLDETGRALELMRSGEALKVVVEPGGGRMWTRSRRSSTPTPAIATSGRASR